MSRISAFDDGKDMLSRYYCSLYPDRQSVRQTDRHTNRPDFKAWSGGVEE